MFRPSHTADAAPARSRASSSGSATCWPTGADSCGVASAPPGSWVAPGISTSCPDNRIYRQQWELLVSDKLSEAIDHWYDSGLDDLSRRACTVPSGHPTSRRRVHALGLGVQSCWHPSSACPSVTTPGRTSRSLRSLAPSGTPCTPRMSPLAWSPANIDSRPLYYRGGLGGRGWKLGGRNSKPGDWSGPHGPKSITLPR